uniref:LIM zinc-binding domain-containing protein n=1 Tax=Timema bartmani TaxID=61472 RepID=A0A7R9F7M0_9NEOP|nr:unnamed protein product [Timema bartmani]
MNTVQWRLNRKPAVVITDSQDTKDMQNVERLSQLMPNTWLGQEAIQGCQGHVGDHSAARGRQRKQMAAQEVLETRPQFQISTVHSVTRVPDFYTKADLILCRRDYLRLFGNTGHCAACSKVIPAFEMVMRARNNVYHLECFACQQCNHRKRSEKVCPTYHLC